ncbi:MAG: cupin domain-containing protein [Acetobacteraceae bacterium]|nr:cupin domain-containing protein [Acetobacteraceae bacterium]MBV9775682.1 cupin domain-containing protein [Acetobacteraceae bacterium]
MAIQQLRIDEAIVLRSPGKWSAQIVWPGNAPDARVTITRVSMEPGAVSARHSHPRSEQIWIVERGVATLLLGDGTRTVTAGDVVRTPPGDTHGAENTGHEPFVYLAVTCPPEDMSGFYAQRDDGPAQEKRHE